MKATLKPLLTPITKIPSLFQTIRQILCEPILSASTATAIHYFGSFVRILWYFFFFCGYLNCIAHLNVFKHVYILFPVYLSSHVFHSSILPALKAFLSTFFNETNFKGNNDSSLEQSLTGGSEGSYWTIIKTPMNSW